LPWIEGDPKAEFIRSLLLILSTPRHFRLSRTLPTGRFRFNNLDAVKAATSEFLQNPQEPL
jgi:hypothetical protein